MIGVLRRKVKVLKISKSKKENKIWASNLIYENCLLFGHNSSQTASNINKYIIGTRATLEIFKFYELRYLLLRISPLIQTLFKMARAPLGLSVKGVANKKLPFWKKEHVFKVSSPNKPPQILFATITPAFGEIISEAARICQMPHHQQRWLNGSITGAISYLFEEDIWRHASKKSTIAFFRQKWGQNKENWPKSEERARYEQRSRWPSLVIIPDIINNDMILSEIQKVGLPVIGLVNSNCSVEIEYPIFAQDQSFSSVHFFCHFLATLIAKEMIFWEHRAYIKQNSYLMYRKKAKNYPRVGRKNRKAIPESEIRSKLAINDFLFQSYLPSKNNISGRILVRQRKDGLYAMHILELEDAVPGDSFRQHSILMSRRLRKSQNLRVKIRQKLRKWSLKNLKNTVEPKKVPLAKLVNISKELPKIKILVELLRTLAKKQAVEKNAKIKVKPNLEFLHVLLRKLHPDWDFVWNKELKTRLYRALKWRQPSVWRSLRPINAILTPKVLRELESNDRRWHRRAKYRFWSPQRRLLRAGHRVRLRLRSRLRKQSQNLKRSNKKLNYTLSNKKQLATRRRVKAKMMNIWVKVRLKIKTQKVFRKAQFLRVTRTLGKRLYRAEEPIIKKKKTREMRLYCGLSKGFWLGPRFKNLWQLHQQILKKNSSPQIWDMIKEEEKEKSLLSSSEQNLRVKTLLQNFLRMPKQMRVLWKNQIRFAPLFKLAPTLYHEWSSTGIVQDLKWTLHKHIVPGLRKVRSRKRLNLFEVVEKKRKKVLLKVPSSFSRVKKPWKTRQHWQKWMQQAKWDLAAAHREQHYSKNHNQKNAWKKKNWKSFKRQDDKNKNSKPKQQHKKRQNVWRKDLKKDFRQKNA